MALYSNALIRRGGDVIRANVDVDSSVPVTGPSAGAVEWSGVLKPPNNVGLVLGETYTLILPGFSPAKIVITGEANPLDGTVTFKGAGDVPASAPPQRHRDPG